jgi:adenosine deaminase
VRVSRAAELALRYQDRGVLAFDLAGPEAGHPATDHAELLRSVLAQGLPLTLHAGEADAGWRVIEAARLGARRVGHGVHFADLLGTPEGPALCDELRSEAYISRVHNNLHGAAVGANHPIRPLGTPAAVVHPTTG